MKISVRYPGEPRKEYDGVRAVRIVDHHRVGIFTDDGGLFFVNRRNLSGNPVYIRELLERNPQALGDQSSQPIARDIYT